jgi:hypothetical protein
MNCEEARIACEKALQKPQEPSIPTVCDLNMLDLVLENNHFSFNGKNQNIIEFPGNGCGILFKFCSNSVVSFM